MKFDVCLSLCEEFRVQKSAAGRGEELEDAELEPARVWQDTVSAVQVVLVSNSDMEVCDVEQEVEVVATQNELSLKKRADSVRCSPVKLKIGPPTPIKVGMAAIL